MCTFAFHHGLCRLELVHHGELVEGRASSRDGGRQAFIRSEINGRRSRRIVPWETSGWSIREKLTSSVRPDGCIISPWHVRRPLDYEAWVDVQKESFDDSRSLRTATEEQKKSWLSEFKSRQGYARVHGQAWAC